MTGAHLCDDNVNGKSVEWNFGAAGGLEEGEGVAQYLGAQKMKQVDPDSGIQSILSVKQSLMDAYSAHCRANGIPIRSVPRVAYVEKDDIYYSSVRTVRKLIQNGMDIRYTFHHTLRFDGKRLRFSDQTPIDVLYLDCHIEELYSEHPVVQALLVNCVALDSSVFGRLVLRSKAVMAGLFDPDIRDELNLSDKDQAMIERHLAHTRLFADLCKSEYILPPDSKWVVKIGFGSVFGGKEVKVFDSQHLNKKAVLNAKEFKPSLERLLIEHATAEQHDLRAFSKSSYVKSLFLELWQVCDPNKDIGSFKAFQKDVNACLGTSSRITFSRFSKVLQTELNSHFQNNDAAQRLKNRILNLYSGFFTLELLNENLPIVVQPFIPAQPISGEADPDQYISHRIHVLCMKNSKSFFLCGSQVFMYRDGKQDNKSKQTCALTVKEEYNDSGPTGFS